MKKLFAILAAAMMIVCASSCNKVAKTLAGTEWTTTFDAISYNLSFDATTFTMVMTFESESDSITGTYSYTYPNVSLTVDGETTPATVSADYKTMTFEEGPTFTRKK